MTSLPAALVATLLAQNAPVAEAPAFDRSQVVIRDGGDDRPERPLEGEPGPPALPLEGSFWTPVRLALGVAAVVIAGAAAAAVVARSSK